MRRQDFNTGWTFQYDHAGNFANFVPSLKDGEQVTLPHDFIIGLDRDPNVPGRYRTGYFPGAAGIYMRDLDAEALTDQKVILEIDGAFMNAVVMVNSDIVQRHPYGYTAFHADLTKYLKPGKKNRLAVYVNNCFLPNSRWYTGGGLYRDVNLLLSGRVHLAPWALFIKTESLTEEEAVIAVEAAVQNESEEDFRGSCICRVEYGGGLVQEFRLPAEIKAGTNRTLCCNIPIASPRIWDIDTPDMYRMTVSLQKEGREIDSDSTDFGIRTISADSVNGLLLNGTPVKLKGGCVHHDCGILGAAAYRDYEYRRVKIHKENGFNAIRCSHNPPSSHFLDACDRYGILVMDEAFDCWRMGKTLNDYSLFFEDWWERDLTSMILRDRNHPSVIMWSIGNEIGERAGDSDGYCWAEKIAGYARGLDSTRLITSGICAIWPTENQEEELEDILFTEEKIKEVNLDTPFSRKYWGEYTEKYAKTLDVVGYNYMENRYKEDGISFPGRVICGTESFARNIDKIWELVEECPHVIGDFAWTSYDYIGEAGIGKARYFTEDAQKPSYEIAHDSPYPWRLANDADFDICGCLTPQGAYRKIVWGSGETYIAVHNPANFSRQEVLSLWGWPDCRHDFTYPGYEGMQMKVSVYSKAPEVELFHNGKSLGRMETQRLTADYSITYTPGELRAVSYENDRILSEDMIRTAGAPYRISMKVELADRFVQDQQLVFVVLEIVDREGNLVRESDRLVEVNVTGELILKAIGSADPCSEEKYTGTSFTTYQGRVLAVVSRKDSDEENVVKNQETFSGNRLQVTADGLLPASMNLW